MLITWSGRQLYKYKDGNIAEIYHYDADGLRAKTVHYVYSAEVKDYVTTGETRYEYAGDKLVYQVTTDADDVITKELYFFYDSNDNLSYIKFYKNNGAQNGNYFVTTNLQGDVLGLYDSNGSLAVSYEYDAWGNVISVKGSSGAELTLEAHPNHIGIVNPIRYRGYYYNETTKLYYLQSRYYDAEIGRFINADDTTYLGADGTLLSYNLFSYCKNNATNLSDETGALPSWAIKLAVGIGAIALGAVAVAATAATGGAAAAFVGAAVAGLKAAAVSGAVGAAIGAGTSAASHRISTGSWNGAGEVAVNGAVDGFANGFMTGGIMAGGSQILSSGFKVAANAGVPTGRNGGLTIGNKVRALSPNHPQAYEAGGTLLKIGSKYKNIRFDVGSNSMFHMNIQLAKTVNYHLPIGILCSGLWGGVVCD